MKIVKNVSNNQRITGNCKNCAKLNKGLSPNYKSKFVIYKVLIIEAFNHSFFF